MDSYLMHYGVLGQKWGVRRYQNPDGTLTAEGKARMKVDIGKYNEDASVKADKAITRGITSGALGASAYGLYGVALNAGKRAVEAGAKSEALMLSPTASSVAIAAQDAKYLVNSVLASDFASLAIGSLAAASAVYATTAASAVSSFIKNKNRAHSLSKYLNEDS